MVGIIALYAVHHDDNRRLRRRFGGHKKPHGHVAAGLQEIEAVVLRCLGRERTRGKEEQRKTEKYFFRVEVVGQIFTSS